MDWKEINEGIESLLSQAAEGKTGDEAKTARADALKSLGKSYTQPFFDAGFASADGKRKDEVETAEAKVKAAETALETAQAKLAELEKKNPDVTAIKEQYQKEILDLKATHQTEVEKLNGLVATKDVDGFLTRLRSTLERRVKPDTAELAILKMRERVRPTKDGGVEVLQEGKDIPYHASTLDELIGTIADDVYAKAPEDRRLSKADGGGGSDSGGTGGGSEWGKYRERAKETSATPSMVTDEERTARLASL